MINLRKLNIVKLTNIEQITQNIKAIIKKYDHINNSDQRYSIINHTVRQYFAYEERVNHYSLAMPTGKMILEITLWALYANKNEKHFTLKLDW